MTNKKLTVTDDLVVSLAYTLRFDDGEIIDSATDQEPLEFLQGWGQIIPGLERSLYGLAVNDEKEVVVAPADGYGEPDLDEFEELPRDAFPSNLALTEGMSVRLRDDRSGEVFEAYITEISPDTVLLDFNHPLAGETLYFQVKIAALRQATQEELAHGHVHDPGDES